MPKIVRVTNRRVRSKAVFVPRRRDDGEGDGRIPLAEILMRPALEITIERLERAREACWIAGDRDRAVVGGVLASARDEGDVPATRDPNDRRERFDDGIVAVPAAREPRDGTGADSAVSTAASRF